MKKLLITFFTLFVVATSFAQLPSVQLKNLKGEEVNTGKLSNDGKPIIISFFATWCKPCLRELKAIHEVYPDWQDETGVKLIAVSIDDAQNANKVRPLVEANDWDYEVLLDPNSDFKRAMNVNMVPSVFIVDKNGKIVYQHTGYTDGSEVELIKKVRELCK